MIGDGWEMTLLIVVGGPAWAVGRHLKQYSFSKSKRSIIGKNEIGAGLWGSLN